MDKIKKYLCNMEHRLGQDIPKMESDDSLITIIAVAVFMLSLLLFYFILYRLFNFKDSTKKRKTPNQNGGK